MDVQIEKKGSVAVAWSKGSKHKFYEDRFRMLSRDVPIVHASKRGEMFAVFDGIGSAPEGRHSAQVMSENLVNFYKEPDMYSCEHHAILDLLMDTNRAIHDWGFINGTDRPLGGCAGTVAWIYNERLYIYHAGDTCGILIKGIDQYIPLTRDHQRFDGAIIKYFGFGELLKIDVGEFDLEEGDRILMLSDGVTKVYHPMEAAALVDDYSDIGLAVKDLARMSVLKGSTDDVTAMLIEIEEL